MRRLLSVSWERRTVTSLLLWPASVLYGAVVGLHRRLYLLGMLRVQRVAIPVVVVGNVVAGGGGKTPVVMALVRHLLSRGLSPGVVSRGYGRHRRDCREVLEDSQASDVGDEPILIRHATGAPVFVAPARIDAARALLAQYPSVDVIVCDDGLQHLGLHRDIEICVFDDRGTGNGLLLPAGPLREPWPRRTDLVLSTRNDTGVGAFAVRRELASHARRADGAMVALHDLRPAAALPGRSLRAVAGIARPGSFFAMLRARGLQLSRTDALADHAAFEARDWTDDDDTLLCTEKDAVKLWRHRPDALAVPLELRVEPAFWSAFDRLLELRLGAKLSCNDGQSTA